MLWCLSLVLFHFNFCADSILFIEKFRISFIATRHTALNGSFVFVSVSMNRGEFIFGFVRCECGVENAATKQKSENYSEIYIFMMRNTKAIQSNVLFG